MALTTTTTTTTATEPDPLAPPPRTPPPPRRRRHRGIVVVAPLLILSASSPLASASASASSASSLSSSSSSSSSSLLSSSSSTTTPFPLLPPPRSSTSRPPPPGRSYALGAASVSAPGAAALARRRRRRRSRRRTASASAAASVLSFPRGGSLTDPSDCGVGDDFDLEYDDDDYDFDDVDPFSGPDADLLMAEDDFGEDGLTERMASAWSKTPPFTKAYLSASMAATASGYLLNKNEFPKLLLLEWRPILTRLQVWRPFTAFLNFGPFGLGYAMTGHFVWTYMSTLERLNHDAPYEFWIMILFGCCSMVGGYTLLNLSPRFLGHNLSTFLVYVWSRYHEGMEVNMFEMFNARAEMLPWLFLAQTFLLEGEVPVLDLLGIVFGHIYHHFKTAGIIRAPRFVVDWYRGDGRLSRAIRDRYRTISSDFEMVQ